MCYSIHNIETAKFESAILLYHLFTVRINSLISLAYPDMSAEEVASMKKLLLATQKDLENSQNVLETSQKNLENTENILNDANVALAEMTTERDTSNTALCDVNKVLKASMSIFMCMCGCRSVCLSLSLSLSVLWLSQT